MAYSHRPVDAGFYRRQYPLTATAPLLATGLRYYRPYQGVDELFVSRVAPVNGSVLYSS